MKLVYVMLDVGLNCHVVLLTKFISNKRHWIVVVPGQILSGSGLWGGEETFFIGSRYS